MKFGTSYDDEDAPSPPVLSQPGGIAPFICPECWRDTATFNTPCPTPGCGRRTQHSPTFAAALDAPAAIANHVAAAVEIGEAWEQVFTILARQTKPEPYTVLAMGDGEQVCFTSTREAGQWGGTSQASVMRAMQDGRKIKGRIYIDMTIPPVLKPAASRGRQTEPVVYTVTGALFPSIKEAAATIGVSRRVIEHDLTNGRRRSKPVRFVRPSVWAATRPVVA